MAAKCRYCWCRKCQLPQHWLDALNNAGINIAGIRRSRLPIGLEIKFLYHADGSRTGTTANPIIDFADRHFPNMFRVLTARLLPAFIHPRLTDLPEAYYQAVGVHITPMLLSRQTEFLSALDQKIKLKTLDLLTPDILPKRQRYQENLPELSLADAVLPSDAECEAYFGYIHPQEAAKKLAEKGAQVVVIKQENKVLWFMNWKETVLLSYRLIQQWLKMLPGGGCLWGWVSGRTG